MHCKKENKTGVQLREKKNTSNILSSCKSTNKRLRVKGLSTFERTSKRPKLTNEHRLNEVTTHEVQPRPILPGSMCRARKLFARVVFRTWAPLNYGLLKLKQCKFNIKVMWLKRRRSHIQMRDFSSAFVEHFPFIDMHTPNAQAKQKSKQMQRNCIKWKCEIYLLLQRQRRKKNSFLIGFDANGARPSLSLALTELAKRNNSPWFDIPSDSHHTQTHSADKVH